MSYYWYDGKLWRWVGYCPPHLTVPVALSHMPMLHEAGIQMCLVSWLDGQFLMVGELTVIQWNLSKLSDPYALKNKKVLYERKS